MNKTITNIIGTIKYFNWNVINIWVENNCIYAERIRANGEKVAEGLYAGSDLDSEDIYKIYNKLKYVMNFNNMLNDDNILI